MSQFRIIAQGLLSNFFRSEDLGENMLKVAFMIVFVVVFRDATMKRDHLGRITHIFRIRGKSSGLFLNLGNEILHGTSFYKHSSTDNEKPERDHKVRKFFSAYLYVTISPLTPPLVTCLTDCI